MSLVLAGGNKNYIVVAADQRAMDKNGQVMSENYQKVFRINEDFVVAFAGKIPYCRAILEPILEGKKNDDSMFCNVNMSEIIEHRMEMAEEELKKTGEDCYFSIIVCGTVLHSQSRDMMRNPLFMHVYNYKDGLTVKKNLMNDYSIRWSILYGSSYDHHKVCKQLFESNHAITQNQVQKVFQQTIVNGARNDRTVNDNIMFEIIEA